MKKLRGSAILMIIAIVGITGFQGYWLKNNYDREKQSLELKTDAAFRQVILSLQASKLKLDKLTVWVDSSHAGGVSAPNPRLRPLKVKRPAKTNEAQITLLNLIQEKMRDSLHVDSSGRKTMIINISNDTVRRVMIDSIRRPRGTFILSQKMDSTMRPPGMIREIHVDNSGNVQQDHTMAIDYDIKSKSRTKDSVVTENRVGTYLETNLQEGSMRNDFFQPTPHMPGGDAFFRLLYDVDSLSLKDSVRVEEISTAMTESLKDEKIDIDFAVHRLDSTQKASPEAVTIGIRQPQTFELELRHTMGYMLGKLKLPILFSILLVGITLASFVLLYRNLLRQQRLAAVKNEFISNITHELKTPIATVGVAIEALKNFNAIDDAKRTQEYLAISQNELQRLNLLVDKVLKLSMFEKKEIELKPENIKLDDIVQEVVSSMRLQIEKYHAVVQVSSEGDTHLQADRHHLLSVVFNLLDNALKYSRDAAKITIATKEEGNEVSLIVADNGIGIPEVYQDRIFDKFFRIPHGDTHNAKGYGLGLSYTAHVIRQHQGTIRVESQADKGTTFTILLPKTIT